MEWRPIESAPKDGRHILIYNWEGLASIVEVYWQKDEEWEGWVYAEELLAGACPEVDDPTHWMPLPEPPLCSHPSEGENNIERDDESICGRW